VNINWYETWLISSAKQYQIRLFDLLPAQNTLYREPAGRQVDIHTFSMPAGNDFISLRL
jgi:hypothetical protein